MALKTTTMTVEAAMARVAERVNGGRLCWRCGIATGADLHPAADGSGRVEHVADPACGVVRATLIRVRDQLAEMHEQFAACTDLYKAALMTVDEWAQQIADAAPPLTDAQHARLVVLLDDGADQAVAA